MNGLPAWSPMGRYAIGSEGYPSATADTKCYVFDGAADYIEIDGAAGAFNMNAAPFSVSMWFKSSDTTSYQALWSTGWSADNGTIVTIWMKGSTSAAAGSIPINTPVVGVTGYGAGAALWGANDANSSPHGQTASFWVESGDTNGIDPTDGDWHNAVVTSSGAINTNEGIKLYLDGNYVGYSRTGSTTKTMDMVTIGVNRSKQYPVPYPGYWNNGKIAQMTVYTSEVSAADVTAIYASGNSTDESSMSPYDYYRFGDDALDSGGSAGPPVVPAHLQDSGSGRNNGTGTQVMTIDTDSPP